MYTQTVQCCLKALGLSQEEQTSATSVDWHTPQHNVCSAKQKKTWWHINLDMLPRFQRENFVSDLSPKAVVQSGWVWPLVLTQSLGTSHSWSSFRVCQPQTEHTACIWLQTLTRMPDTQSACRGRKLAGATNKQRKCVSVHMCVPWKMKLCATAHTQGCFCWYV